MLTCIKPNNTPTSLFCSTANVKKLEAEMQALKTTNARLTTALQESMTNVDQWHRQLSIYKDENENLKKQVMLFVVLLGDGV